MAQQDFSDLLAAEPGASKAQSAGTGGRASSSDFSDLLASEPVGRSSGSDIDAALAAEGVTGRAAEFIKSIYSQESSSGRNTKTSNAGAVGGMQILPGTFRDVADDGWDINNKEHNLRAGIRYAKQGYDQADGDLTLAGAYYYGGPGGLEKARRGIAVSDPRNPNAPNTLQYGREVAARVDGSSQSQPAQSTQSRQRNPYANTYREPEPEKSIIDQVLDVGKAAWQGAKSTGRSVAATGNTYMGNLSDVELLAKAQQDDVKNDPQALAGLKAEIQRRQQENPDAGILQAASDVVSAAWNNKAGTVQLVAEQAPNAAVSLGAGYAGAKLGAAAGSVFGPAGTAVGGTLGFLTGMFLGNTLLETGGKAQEMAADGFTADEAQAAKEQGAVKGGVITAVDAATLGVGRGIARTLNGAAIKAGARAEAKVLADAGINISNGAEIVEALAKNPALRESARQAGQAAASEASRLTARVGTAATLGATETFGEGAGEYLGDLAATGEANPYDAATEAIAGFAQSAPEVFWSMTQSSGNNLDINGITEVAKKAQEPNSPLSKTVLAAENARMKAGIPSAAEQQAQTTVADPVTRLAELEAIGKGKPESQVTDENGNQITIPGEQGRFFTPEEKAEYDQLKALRDATPGMQPEAEAEAQPRVDEILERTRAIEQTLRTNRGLEALRSPESPYKVGQFLNDLARAKSKSTPAAQREQALARIETVAEWMGVNLGDIAQGVSQQSNEQAGPPTRPQQVGQMITSTPGLSGQERDEALQSMMAWRNTRLPARTRQAALDRALEIVGRTQAPQGRANPDRQPAVMRDIAPQEGAPEYFLREAERREDGAYQFRALGYDDEADALLLEADSLREAAASARAGTLNVEDSAEADADIASQSRALSVDEASGSLPRVQIPASTDQEIGEASTALRRKRKAQIAQIVGNGFDTVERSGEGFVLRNTKTGQSVMLDGMADAQIARNAIKARVDELANTAAASPLNDRLEPTEAQIKAGNYKKSDVIELNGVKVVIENPRGSVRRGVGADGKPWETKMAHHYGEIVGTEGADGDRVDVFIGDRPASNKIFVIDQVNQDGTFDEHKLVFGAVSEADARQTYLANYDKGWTGLGAIKELPLADLKTWLKDHAKKPAAESGMGAIQVRVKGKTYTVSAVPVESLPASSGDSPSRGVKGAQITKQQAILLKGLAGFFGKDIVFFSDPQSKVDSDGFVIPGDDVTIYLNERSGISPLAVFGHELMHILRSDNPAAYDAIAKVVAERVQDPKGFRENYYGKDSAEAKSDAALSDRDLEELISDLNGDLMSDGAFWRDVFAKIQDDNGAQAKSIIANLAAFFQKILDGAIAAIKGQPSFRASRFINDAEAVRNAFRDGMAMYAQGAGISKAAMQAELLKAQQKLGDIKRSAPRPDDGLTVDGYHFSKQARQILSTGFFGTGLQGSDREEIMSNPDMRLRQRLSFYVNKGTGIRPESGVGPIAHKATLTNIYDADADVKRLKQGRDKRAFETAVINAGYSGYLTRLDGSQPGQVILLGSQTVKTEVLGMRTQIDDAKVVPAMAKRDADLGDKFSALKIPLNGQLIPQRWAQMVMARDPELAAQLMDIGAFEGDKPMYQDEFVAMVRQKVGAPKRPSGLQAAGIVFKAADTGRILMAKRGSSVANPGTWSIPGGAVDAGESLEAAALREAKEEIGFQGQVKLARIAEAKFGNATFNTFIATVPSEFSVRLNGENSEAKWVDPDSLPDGLHPGFRDVKDLVVGAAKSKNPAALSLDGSEIKRSAQRAKDEYAEVEAKYKGTDQWLKAPNGGKTNLTERQWVQVRTPAFKKWFGDWEAAIAKGGVWADDSTSKVVDENGEPLVVYHGTDKGGFMEFEQPGGTGRGDFGIFTTPNWDMARSYVRKNRANAVVDSDTSEAGDQPGIYALFLNIRNPNESDFEGATWSGERFGQYQVLDEDGEPIYDEAGNGFFDYETAEELLEKNPGSYIEQAGSHYETTDSVVREAWRYKNDGAIVRNVVDDGGGPGAYDMTPADIFVALSPNQLKSADFNGGEFSAESDDIRRSTSREYKLAIDRESRVKAKVVRLLPEEISAIESDAKKFGLSTSQVKSVMDSAKATKRQYPASEGWAQISVIGINVKKDDNGNIVPNSEEPKFKEISYGFNVPPGKTRASPKLDADLAGKVAKKFEQLILDVYDRAESGDKNAQIIVGHQTWYRNVAEVLRREYGAAGDMLADLLGATSPNTPVDTNWKFSIDIMRRFMRGDFDEQLEKFSAFVERGGDPSKYPAADKIRQISGKLYGMNSTNAMKALVDMWRLIEPGQAPKARNFALNLIGQSNMATIDVWAARMLRRAANMVRGVSLPRIPPVAETGVTGAWNADSTKVTGEFGFGAEVMQMVSDSLAKKGVVVSPPDLQAIAWFAEKELWGQKGWTTKTGEGGSFEENIEATPVERYLAGWSIQQGEKRPEDGKATVAQARVMSMLVGDDTVLAARVMPTYGLYGGTIEASFDTEWTAQKGKHDPTLVMAEIAKLAQENNQWDIFVSRVVQPNEENRNARPGVEIYFRDRKSLDQAMPILERFTSRGQDGFTMAVDPRAKKKGLEDQEFIGVRLQYVPEISMRWDESLREEIMKPGAIEQILDEKRQLLHEIAREVRSMDGVAFASMQQYDTVVVGKENYDEYIDRATEEGRQGARTQAWFGRPVRQGLERAVARLRGEREQAGRGGVQDAGDAVQAKPALSADAQAILDASGVRRSPGRVAEQGRSDQSSGREKDGSLNGLPRDFTVAGIDIRASHWAPAEAVARQYMERAGLEYRPPAKYAKVDKERAARIAAEYDRMKHDPKNPVVKAAYKALTKETIEQYRAVVESGLQVEFIDFASQGDPYAASPRLMTEDVRNNNHMWVFSTRDGFGTDASFDPEDNPLLAETEFEISGQKALVNDLFRVVHDYFGHVKEGVGFRADGEENTWRAHSSMFSPLAQRALTTETRGQNSWVNFGPHGDKNRTASAGETHFADQKTGLLPLWVSEDGRYDEDASAQPDDMTIRIGEETQKSDADEYNQRIAALEELIACLNK